MVKIESNKTFAEALASLSLPQQRQVGAKFVSHVIDLTDGKCAPHARLVAEKDNPTAEELEAAYREVHAIYVSTSPYSGFTAIDYAMQAAHFVAEACMVCLSPTFGDFSEHHLAEKVAGYCRMARLCASVPHEDDDPKLDAAERSLKGEINAQFQILTEYMEGINS